MKAMILAGGLGIRLRPLTQAIPKPLLPIGETSLLEIQILCLKRHGVTEIVVATNYMSDYVEAFLGDGSRFGVSLTISKETKPLGTCGPVTLVKDRFTEPFLLMNGDLLTNLDVARAYDFALALDADLVVVTKEITAPFDFGKVVSEGDYITDVHEKPDFRLEILAGVYILKPPVFDLIPEDTYYGIDSLIKDMLAKGRPIGKYVMKEYWLDIGRIDDYNVAEAAFKEHFSGIKQEP